MKDLSYKNFMNKDMSGYDFSNTNLMGCNFRDSILVGCNFSGSLLHFSNFKGADVSKAIFNKDTKASMTPWYNDKTAIKGIDTAIGVNLVDTLTPPPEDDSDEEE